MLGRPHISNELRAKMDPRPHPHPHTHPYPHPHAPQKRDMKVALVRLDVGVDSYNEGA